MPTRNTIVFVLAAAAAILLDQVSKALVVTYMEPGRSVTIIPHVLSLTHSTNTGAAFGILRGSGQIVFLAALIITGLALAWFFAFRHKQGYWSFIGLGLLIGGALGNLIDRIFRHKVVDFFNLGWWPVFNVADLAIVAGVIIIVVVSAVEILREDAAGNPDHGGA
jgi:signal peptidase II